MTHRCDCGAEHDNVALALSCVRGRLAEASEAFTKLAGEHGGEVQARLKAEEKLADVEKRAAHFRELLEWFTGYAGRRPPYGSQSIWDSKVQEARTAIKE